MKRSFFHVSFFLIILIQNVFAQDLKSYTEFVHQLRQFQNNTPKNVKTPLVDWVIGGIDTNEIVTIADTQTHVGKIIIVNHGKLILNGTLHLDGDIAVAGAGTFEVAGGTLNIIQHYVYEHSALVVDSATWNMHDAIFTSSGVSWALNVNGRARYIIKRTDIQYGFITHTVSNAASIEVADMNLPGEFLAFNTSKMSFSGIDSLLIWLVLPDSSTIDQHLPDSSLVTHWHFASGDPGVQNIPYEITVDSCRAIWWGMLGMSGSSATFRQTNLRVAGLYFTVNDTMIISNLVNGSFHADEIFQIPDRTLHLIDTKVQTWSIYPFGSSRVEVSNSIFGEVLVEDSATAVIINSICDGSGGYASAFGKGLLILFHSLVQSPVVSRASGIVLGAESAFLGSSVTSDETSVMALLNTSYAQEPKAYSSAAIFDEKLSSVQAIIGDQLPLVGTARMIIGSESPVQYQGYQIDYAPFGNDSNWQSIIPLTNKLIREDTLGIWNTAGYPAGNHLLRLQVLSNFAASIPIVAPAQLILSTDIKNSNNKVPQAYSVTNYPNPFNPTTVISYQLPVRSYVKLDIFNILGEKIATIVEGQQEAGYHVETFHGTSLPSGIYFYQFNAEEYLAIRKMILMK